MPMKRHAFLFSALVAGVLCAAPAYADFVDAVRQQLQQQGFRQISVSSTLLGRSKIVARGKQGSREIVMNPKTGEILRDLWTSSEGSTVPTIVGSNRNDATDDDGGEDNGGDDDGGEDNGGDDDGGDDKGGDGDDDGGDDKGGDDKGGDGDSGGGDDGGDGDGGE